MSSYEQPKDPNTDRERRQRSTLTPRTEADNMISNEPVGVYDRPARSGSSFWVALAVIVILALLAVLVILFVL